MGRLLHSFLDTIGGLSRLASFATLARCSIDVVPEFQAFWLAAAAWSATKGSLKRNKREDSRRILCSGPEPDPTRPAAQNEQ